MVVFVNDLPSAERRIDFAVFFLIVLWSQARICPIIFFQACKWAKSFKSCNLIGSESGRNRWQLHLQVCLLFVNEQNPSFSNHFSFKTCAIISISKENCYMMQGRFKNLTLLNIAGQKIQRSSSARPTILEFTSCETWKI